jgi:D-aminopeptidase
MFLASLELETESKAKSDTMRNLITDVPGLRVGNAHDAKLASGVTVVLPDQAAIAAVDVRGGAPGTRETDALALGATVHEVHGLVLSGGSAFGLDAASGVQSYLRQRGQGFMIGSAVIPIVPQAILFDLLNGGDKEWGVRSPYQALGLAACEAADFDLKLGTVGAGYGATTCGLKGGLGSVSCVTPEGFTVGALVAVNAVGSVTVGASRQFWAAPFEQAAEFGGHGFPAVMPPEALTPRFKGGAAASSAENTTIAIIATDAVLTRVQAYRIAVMAQDGLARAVYPAHAPFDGDSVFCLSTGRKPLLAAESDVARVGTYAANCLARAIARGVFEATTPTSQWAGPPAYRDQFKSA